MLGRDAGPVVGHRDRHAAARRAAPAARSRCRAARSEARWPRDSEAPVRADRDRRGPFRRPARSIVRIVTPASRAGPFVARAHALEELCDGDGFDASALPPPPSSRARSSRSPMMRSSRRVSSATMPRYRARVVFVELHLRHRQRFEIAAHGRDRRRQLVRDVGEQLTAGAVRRGERLGAGREVVGHGVERRGDGGDFVAALRRRASRQIAGAESSRRILDGAQPSARGPEDEHGRQQRADHQRAERHQAPASARSARAESRTVREAGRRRRRTACSLTMMGAGRTGRKPAPRPRPPAGAESPARPQRSNGGRRSDGRDGSASPRREDRRAPIARSARCGDALAPWPAGPRAPAQPPLLNSRPSASSTKSGCASRPYCSRRNSRRSAPGRVRTPETDPARRCARSDPAAAPGSVGPDREATQMNSSAWTTSMAARQSDESDGDPPVEAAIPTRRSWYRRYRASVPERFTSRNFHTHRA